MTRPQLMIRRRLWRGSAQGFSPPGVHPGQTDSDPGLLSPLCRRDIAELLRAFSGVALGRINVPFGIERDVVHPVKLARVAAVASERADDLAGLARERTHLVV